MMSRQTQLGFTAIELMTVVVIAGVLLALALPSFNDLLDRRRVEGQANELVTDLAYAKSEAVQRNRSVLLRTDPGGTTCWTVAVMPDPPAGTCDCTIATPSLRCTGGPTELKTVTLTSGITVSPNVQFQFEPVRGTAAAASAVVGLGARTYAVQVTANGRIAPFAQ